VRDRLKVFIDTSAFVALRNASDPNHDLARRARDRLGADGTSLFTSNLIFAETYMAILVRVGRPSAIAWGRGMRTTTAIDLLRVDADVEAAAWEILEAHDDKAWSYVDATSFALMELEGTRHAFAFDRHFEQRGLTLIGP
jgi:predicted nucleic acid-binding protein